ncbi:MAG: hypothetical protein VB070_11330 [Clostridiaceae bacterium]|nr:hypothetical protein [Clostridiaceae bacterium]
MNAVDFIIIALVVLAAVLAAAIAWSRRGKGCRNCSLCSSADDSRSCPCRGSCGRSFAGKRKST